MVTSPKQLTHIGTRSWVISSQEQFWNTQRKSTISFWMRYRCFRDLHKSRFFEKCSERMEFKNFSAKPNKKIDCNWNIVWGTMQFFDISIWNQFHYQSSYPRYTVECSKNVQMANKPRSLSLIKKSNLKKFPSQQVLSEFETCFWRKVWILVVFRCNCPEKISNKQFKISKKLEDNFLLPISLTMEFRTSTQSWDVKDWSLLVMPRENWRRFRLIIS